MDLFKMILAAIPAIVISIPFHLLMKKLGLNKTKGERIVAKAKRAGRVATGRLVSSKLSHYAPWNQDYHQRQQLWHVTYEYEVKRRVYQYRTQMDGDVQPPEEVDLYYPKGHPEKAMAEGGHRYDGMDISVVLLPVVLWAIFYWTVF